LKQKNRGLLRVAGSAEEAVGMVVGGFGLG